MYDKLKVSLATPRKEEKNPTHDSRTDTSCSKIKDRVRCGTIFAFNEEDNYSIIFGQEEESFITPKSRVDESMISCTSEMVNNLDFIDTQLARDELNDAKIALDRSDKTEQTLVLPTDSTLYGQIGESESSSYLTNEYRKTNNTQVNWFLPFDGQLRDESMVNQTIQGSRRELQGVKGFNQPYMTYCEERKRLEESSLFLRRRLVH